MNRWMDKEDVVSHCNIPLYVVHDISCNTKKDPVGFQATKAFLCLPFLWLQEIGFVQPPCPPLNIVKVKLKSLSRVQLFGTPQTIAYQAPQSTEFSRQEYWSGLPFPSPGDLPNPGIEPGCPALQADALPSEPPIGKFNQLLIRQEESGDKGGTVKKNVSAALGNVLVSHQGIHTTSLSSFTVKQFYTEIHTRWEKLTACCPQAHIYQIGWNQKVDDADSHLPHHQPIRRMYMSWTCPLWMIAIKLLTTPSRLWKSFSCFQLFVTPWTV